MFYDGTRLVLFVSVMLKIGPTGQQMGANDHTGCKQAISFTR